MTVDQMQRDIPRDGGEVLRMLDEQAEHCRHLDELSVRQSDLIDEGDYEALLSLLSDREDVIASLTTSQIRLESMRLQWGSLISWLPDELKQRAKRRMDELSTLTARIARRDAVDRAKLETNRSEAASQLGSISNSRGALAAYIRHGADAPAFQDRQA